MSNSPQRESWRRQIAHAYQPVVDTKSESVLFYEALLRSPQGDSPGDVLKQIPYENLNSFETLNRQIAIESALALGINTPLSLNFSLSCLLYRKGDELCELIDYSNDKGLPADQLIIEVSESDSFHDTKSLLHSLDKARAKGALIAVDDFGAGYAGLNTLIDINPDLVKLDMYLINKIHSCGARKSAARAMVSMCRDMGIDLVAEGIEELKEYQTLCDLGIHLQQGYLFARPGLETLPKASYPNQKILA